MYINFLVLEQDDCSLFSLSQTFAFSVASRANTASPRRVASCVLREPIHSPFITVSAQSDAP